MELKTIIWNIVSIIIGLAILVWGKPACRVRFGTEIVCVAGKDDYRLQRGLVSENKNTIAITLKDCRIINVDIEAFKDFYNLEEIDLSRNKISVLKVGAFDGIPKLSSLRLSKNLLTSLPLGLFDNVPKLQRLDLSDNAIDIIELGIFNHIPKLIRLELSGNAILGKDLDSSLFIRNPKIKYLHFSSNNMSEAPDNLLNATRELLVLGLNNCSLTEVPKFVTTGNLKTLEQLRLQTNEIKRLDDPEVFANLENLISLDLFGNLIDKLNDSIFKPLPKLRSIDLSFNKIEQIPETLFQDMASVQNVDLSNNLIDIVPVNAFRRTHLEILDLSGNRITYLDNNFCFELNYFNNRFTSFNFKDNPFQCACLLDILNEVKTLGIKYNSDKYNGEEAVCSMTDAFICMRHKSEFKNPVAIQQSQCTEERAKNQKDDTIKCNSNDGVWSTFGKPNYLVSGSGS